MIIGNMDEVPIYFDMARGTSYHYKGHKNIHVIRTNGYKRRAVLHDEENFLLF